MCSTNCCGHRWDSNPSVTVQVWRASLYTTRPIVRQNLASCHQRKLLTRTASVNSTFYQITRAYNTDDNSVFVEYVGFELKGKTPIDTISSKNPHTEYTLQIYKFIKCWLPAHLTTTVPQLFLWTHMGFEPLSHRARMKCYQVTLYGPSIILK